MHQTHVSIPSSPRDAALQGVAAAPDRFGRRPSAALLAARVDEADATAFAAAAERLAGGYEHEIERRDQAAARLAALRAELKTRNLDGFVIPLADEHQGEYLPQRARRLAWLTGFTGSAGLAVVLADQAAIWSDGRYTLQLDSQVDGALYQRLHITDQPPWDWLSHALGAGARLGYDPWLHTPDGLSRLVAACTRAGAQAIPVDDNPIDAIWADQPPPPLGLVEVQDVAHAGESSADKRARLSAELKQAGQDAALLTLPESIAWLLNIRGADVPHNPVPLSFALLKDDATVDLFIDQRKLGPDVGPHLGNAVALHAPEALGEALDALGAAGRRVRLDPATAPSWAASRLAAAGATLVKGDDPCLLPKACKNPVEMAGTRGAHIRDGAAVCRFLRWLDETAPTGTVDELGAAEQLSRFRQADPQIRDLSFSTISGSGPNGAIVHYRATPESNRRLGQGEIFLLDSGAQYIDGTTDITRTMWIEGAGDPTPEMRDRFTRVLQGHIALARVLFPTGTSGQQLDALARHPLWQAGLDYDHGTGHGVGAFLSVHEGPQRIAKAGSPVPLKPGMIVSNEPGYYKTGAYGIRIENLQAVTDVVQPEGAERRLLGFETLTFVPIDRRLIAITLLSSDERAWVDDYHRAVRTKVGPLLDGEDRAWLDRATEPL